MIIKKHLGMPSSLRQALPLILVTCLIAGYFLYDFRNQQRIQRAFDTPALTDTIEAEIIKSRYSKNHFIYTLRFYRNGQPVSATLHADRVQRALHSRIPVRFLIQEPEQVRMLGE